MQAAAGSAALDRVRIFPKVTTVKPFFSWELRLDKEGYP